MTRTPAPPLTAAELARVDRPACPEGWEERVTRLASALGMVGLTPGPLTSAGILTTKDARELARAALAVMPPVVPAMLALAEEMDEASQLRPTHGEFDRGVAAHQRDAASRIRAALSASLVGETTP